MKLIITVQFLGLVFGFWVFFFLMHRLGNEEFGFPLPFQKLIDEISVDSLTMFERLFLFVFFVFSSHLTCSKDLWAKER